MSNESTVRIKICGMRESDNILSVAQLDPDFMGFIFYRGTPRFVGDDFKVPDTFPPGVQRVGVFVNETTEAILDHVRRFCLDYVQLHGGEGVQQCRQLKEQGVGVIKVFSVDEEMDFGVTAAFADCADFFLFDTKGKLYGGNAKRFDWRVLDRYHGPVPFFLSGGITADHMNEVKKLNNAFLAVIDINSGVEERPGFKDVNKIKAVKAALHTNN